MQKKYLKDNDMFLFFCALITSLVFFRDIYGLNFNKFTIVALVGIAAFLLSYQKLIVLFCYLIPFFSGISGNYIIVILCIAILLKTKQKIGYPLIMSLITIIIFELFNSFGYGVKIIDLLMYFFTMFTIAVLLNIDRDRIDITQIIFAYSVGSVIVLTIILINTLSLISLGDFFSRGYRFGNVLDLSFKNVEGMILSNDQNFVAYSSIIGISSLILALGADKTIRPINRKLAYLCISLLAFYGILTISRAFIISFILLISFYLFNYFIVRYNFKNFLITLLLLIIFYLIIQKFFPVVIETFTQRFSESDISGGRNDINKYYISFFLGNFRVFFLGTGIFHMMDVADYKTTIHNAILQVLVSYGVVGSLAFISLYYLLVKNEMKSLLKKIHFEAVLPHLLGLIIIQSLPFISPYYNMIPMIITAFAFRFNDKLN